MTASTFATLNEMFGNRTICGIGRDMVTTGRLHPIASDDKALEWFYLGGLDNYRIAFNDDFSRSFRPSKRHFRSDDVDSQRGEAEWRGGNLYFDQLDYDFDWQVLPAAQGRSGK